MKKCKVPKIVLAYKSLASFIWNIDIGVIIDLETLAVKFNVEAFPGVYTPLKPFLLKLADLYLFLDERVPCLHWFNAQKGVLYIAIGADGAQFGRDDTATGNYISRNIAHTVHRAIIIPTAIYFSKQSSSCSYIHCCCANFQHIYTNSIPTPF